MFVAWERKLNGGKTMEATCKKHNMAYRFVLGEHCCPQCRANRLRRERHQVYTDLGMVRVKGNLGGTYYE